ncbi:MAG: hypothetical protein K2X93_10875 [Candidatus Obscuribacterales bacterium]|nr:hypothetical protein [Candidatus Obscuribacterales bacterium]
MTRPLIKPIGRTVLLTSLFCLISADKWQPAYARSDDSGARSARRLDPPSSVSRASLDVTDAAKGRGRFANSDASFRQNARQEWALRRDQVFRTPKAEHRFSSKFQVEQEPISSSPSSNKETRKHAAENGALVTRGQNVPRITLGVADGGATQKQIDLDLTSTESAVVLGKKLFGDADSIQITVGGETRTFRAGDKATAAEYLAVTQVANDGVQSLVLNAQGGACGGRFSLAESVSRRVDDLVIAQGVTAIDYIEHNERVQIGGDLTNYGSINAVSVGERNTKITLSGKNLINVAGGSISAAEGRTGDAELHLGSSSLTLTVKADERIANTGAISSDGFLILDAGDSIGNGASTDSLGIQQIPSIKAHQSITLSSGTGSFSNEGLISSSRGDINLLSPSNSSDIYVKAERGVFEASSGDINVRSAAYGGDASVVIQGGDYLSKKLNIFSGGGNIDGSVGQVVGSLNTRAGIEHFYASTELLKIGDNCITGDPTFANTTGGIQIQGVNSFGEAVAFLANGDIIADSTAQIVANGYDVYMVAGANVTVSFGPETSTVPGTQIVTGTATVDFTPGAGAGGSIDLRASNVATIIDTGSSSIDGGNVVLAAVANGNVGGFVRLNTSSTIQTSSTASDGSAGDVTVYAGADPAAAAITIELGDVVANAGPGNGVAGSINIATVKPTGSNGTPVTFNSLGQVIGGSITAATISANGKISVGNLTNNSSSSMLGGVSVSAGSSIFCGDISSAGNVTLKAPEVTVGSITAGGEIDVPTSTLHVLGNISSSKLDGQITVESQDDLTIDGGGSFSLTGGGAGQINLDANDDHTLAFASSLTFNPGANGVVTATSEEDGGEVSIAAGAVLTVNDGADFNVGAPLLNFLGDGAEIHATMASEITVSSGGGLHSLTIASPDNGAAAIRTTGGVIDIEPTFGHDLVFTNFLNTGMSTLNLMGGPVTTSTAAAGTFVQSGVHLNSDSALSMGVGANGGIIGLGFQPYVGSFVNGNQTTQFDGYSLGTVTQLMQQLKNDGYTDVATYSQGSFYFAGQFYGPTAATAGSNKFNIQAANAVGLGISAGVFQQGVNGDGFVIADTMQEVQYILNQAQLYPGTVKEIILLNESIVGPNSLNQLNTLITQAKALRDSTPISSGSSTMFSAATLPITTRQRWDVVAGVNNNANPLQGSLKTMLNSLESHIYVNMYAYFDGNLPTSFSTNPNDQAAFTTAVTNSMNSTLNALRNDFQAQNITIPVRLGETGWPTQGLRAPPLSTAPALADTTLAKWYFEAMKTFSASNSIPTVIFQAYDQPWQTVPAAQVPTTAGSSEGFFGLYTANGTSTVNSFTLSSITNKFTSSSSMSNARLLSNAGMITANDIAINTPELANNGVISALHSTGGVAVSSSSDFDLTGTGTISRVGGGPGSISFSTIGANDLEVRGTQTIDAGQGNAVVFNAVSDGASMTISQGSVINLPTNNTAVSINTEHLLQNGIINQHEGTNPGTTVSINGAESSTIASSVGNLDLNGLDINVASGHLALLSAGSIVNTGSQTTIRLESAGHGGNLILIAGHSFDEVTLGTEDPIYLLDPVSNTTGSVDFNSAGHEVTIDTSGSLSGGRVEVYANGSVTLGSVKTSGGAGLSGDLIVKAHGVTVGDVDTSAASSTKFGTVDIQSGTVTHDGVNVLCGTIDSGSFSVSAFDGNVVVGAITASVASLRTDGVASSISFSSALPVVHELSLTSGVGTVNLPTALVTVQEDAVGNGGGVVLEGAVINLGSGSTLTVDASGSAGKGGSFSYTLNSSADLTVDSSTFQVDVSGADGGAVIIENGGNMTVAPSVLIAGPTDSNGDGASFALRAGLSASGNLLVLGDLIGAANGTGVGGSIVLGSNSLKDLEIGLKQAKNGVRGQVSVFGSTPGSFSASNGQGGVTVHQDFPTGVTNFTVSTVGATKGDIVVKNAITALGTITLSVGGEGRLSTRLLTGPSISLSAEDKTINADLNTSNLQIASLGSVKLHNFGTNPITINGATVGKTFVLSTEGTIITTNDISAISSVTLETSDGDINIGGSITASDPEKGVVNINNFSNGNIVDVNAGGTDAISAEHVDIRGGTGSIGTGSTSATAVRVATHNLQVFSSGAVNVYNIGTDPVSLKKASSPTSFTMTSDSTILASSGAFSATSILLDTSTGAGDIVLDKALGNSTTTSDIVLKTLSGNILSSSKRISASNSVSLSTSGGGAIGSDSDALTIESPQLQVASLGTANLVSKAGAPLLLLDSSASGNFTLATNGDLTLNDIAVTEGSLSITSASGQVQLNAGATLSADSGGPAGTASITIQGQSKKDSSILLGSGSNVLTSGIGGGDVSIFIGSAPPPPVSAVTPGTTGNIFVVATLGGQVFADLNSLIANGPVNNLSGLGKNVYINGGANAAITLDGGVTITADPPASAVSLAESPSIPMTVLSDDLRSSEMPHSLDAAAFARGNGMDSQSVIKSSVSSTFSLPEMVTAFPDFRTTLLETSQARLFGGQNSNDVLASLTSSANSRVALSSVKGLSSSLSSSKFDGVISADESQLLPSNQVESDGVDAVHIDGQKNASWIAQLHEASEGRLQAALSDEAMSIGGKGAVVFTPTHDLSLTTPHGSLSIKQGSVVFVVFDNQSMSIFNLHDNRQSAVSWTDKSSSNVVRLRPAQHLSISTADAKDFCLVNPVESFEYRGIRRSQLADGASVFTSEFSLPTAFRKITPINRCFASKAKTAKRMSSNLLKTTAILAHLDSSSEDFITMPHPRLAVYQNSEPSRHLAH